MRPETKARAGHSDSHPAFTRTGKEPGVVGDVGKYDDRRGPCIGGLRIFASEGDDVSTFAVGVEGDRWG